MLVAEELLNLELADSNKTDSKREPSVRRSIGESQLLRYSQTLVKLRSFSIVLQVSFAVDSLITRFFAIMNNRSKCVVIVPVAHRIEPEVDSSLRVLESRGYRVWREYGFSAIDFGRCVLATRAVEMGFEETLWIDSDIQFSPDDVDRLRSINWNDGLTSYSASRFPQIATQIESLSSLYPAPGIVCGVYAKKDKTGFAAQFMDSDLSVPVGVEGEILFLLYVGAGMMLVRSWVYNRIVTFCKLPTCKLPNGLRAIPYFLPMVVIETDGNASYLCEDYALCERARIAGVPIMADTTIPLLHIGISAIGWNDLDAFRKS